MVFMRTHRYTDKLTLVTNTWTIYSLKTDTYSVGKKIPSLRATQMLITGFTKSR
jgi:hypothetical protein